MNLLSQIIVGFIALLHIYILWLEMFAWTTRARKVFKTIPEDQFEKTKVTSAINSDQINPAARKPLYNP